LLSIYFCVINFNRLKNALMKSVQQAVAPWLTAILAGYVLFGSLAQLHAQEAEQEVRIKIQRNINGSVTEIDTVVKGGNANINDLMRNFNLQLQMPGLQPTEPSGSDKQPRSGLADKSHKRFWRQDNNADGNPELNESSSEASLGIVTEAKEANDDEEGVKVNSVIAGSAAEKAGLKPGDLIMKIDGTELYASEDLVREIKAHQPGDAVTITYIRNGKRNETQAILQEPDFEDFLQGQSWMGDFFNPEIWSNDPQFNDWADELDRFRKQMEEHLQEWNRQNEQPDNHWNDFDAPLAPPGENLSNNPSEPELQPEKMSLAVDASQQQFDLSFTLSERGNATVRIMNAQGNILFEDNASGFPGTYRKTIKPNTTGSLAGTYFLQIVQNGKMYNKKITVY